MAFSPHGRWRIERSGIGRPAPMTYSKLPVTQTFVWTDDAGNTHIRYHETDVVSFNDDWITLRTGGWKTLMTITIMNSAAGLFNLGFEVFTQMPKLERPIQGHPDAAGRYRHADKRQAKDADWFVEFQGSWPFDGDTISLNRKTSEMVAEDKVAPTDGDDLKRCKRVYNNPGRPIRRNPGVDDIDVEVGDEGSIILFKLVSGAAKTWWKNNVSEGLMHGDRYVVEHRYAGDIVEGMMADGLNVNVR